MCRWNRCSAVGSVRMCKYCGTKFCTECLRGDFIGLIKDEKCIKCNSSLLSAEVTEIPSKPDRKETLWNVLTPTQAAWNIYSYPCSKRIKILEFIKEFKYGEDYKNMDEPFTQYSALMFPKKIPAKSKEKEDKEEQIKEPEKVVKEKKIKQKQVKPKQNDTKNPKKAKKSKKSKKAKKQK